MFPLGRKPPLIMTGSNAWWLAHLSENSDVDKALAEIANVNHELKVFMIDR